jgi:DNA-binding transcriptional ArsR family regulator
MTKRAKPPIATYSALADATRCRIVEILLAGPIPVHQLADAFSISRPAISRHLRVLKTAGLVVEVKKGRENLYTLKVAKLSGAIKWLNGVAAPETEEGPAAEKEAPVRAATAPAADMIVVKPPAPKKVRPPTPPEAAGKAASADDHPLFAPKPDRAPRAAKETPVSQMGFDF